MTYEKLPNDIIYIKRRRREIRLLAITLALMVWWLLLHYQIFENIFRNIEKEAPWRHGQIITILNCAYIILPFSRREKLRDFLYKKLGYYNTNDFIEVFEGKFVAKFPAPKLLPVWVLLISKWGPVIFVSVIPYLIFGMLGWHIPQFGSLMLFLLYSGEIISSFYYMTFWNRYMIEYIRLGSVFGITHYGTYFFKQENIEIAQKYIEDKEQSKVGPI